jgi:hypothetical protein
MQQPEHTKSALSRELPSPTSVPKSKLRLLPRASRAWLLKRLLDTIEENTHAFLLPSALRVRVSDYNPPDIEVELARIQSEIDAIAFDLYGFSEADRAAVQGNQINSNLGDGEASVDDESDEEDSDGPIDQTAGLLSWAVGVAFGRFDWRLATGEREAPPEPEPFDPLPAKSPGMLPDGAAPFHDHGGILVDDPGHPHDLAHLVEEVLVRVERARAWRRAPLAATDFFAFHLQRYSKSRRKAPIYWPLAPPRAATPCGSITPASAARRSTPPSTTSSSPSSSKSALDVTAAQQRFGRTRDDEKQFEPSRPSSWS